jgi:hypothetical protein
MRLVVDSLSCNIRPRIARKNGERWKRLRRLLMCVETPHGPPPYFSSSPSYLRRLHDRARELARGLREQIIVEGNEESPGESENEDKTVDARKEEWDVPE